MKEENQTIIKAINLFGRVPEQYELLEEIESLQNQLQQKENIIKEVREYLQETINRWEDYEQFYEVVVEDKYILEILDKVGDNYNVRERGVQNVE